MEQPNLSEVYKLAGGDIDFEKKIIAVIKREFPLEKENYFKELNAQNHQKAAAFVHKLKHKISSLSMIKGYTIATDYENSLKMNKQEGRSDFEAILVVISTYLETI